MGIYLDNASTSYPKPDCVLSAMENYFKNIGANAGRSAYKSAQETSKMVFETRESIAKLIGAKDSSRIVFTLNATEGLNIAILGSLKEGDSVITTSMEHNSVMRPLRFLEKNRGVKVTLVRCSEKGVLDPDDIRKKIRVGRPHSVSLLIVTSASNVVGTIMPIYEIGRIAKEYNIPFLVDAAQTIGILPIDVQQANIDLLAFSGHKGLMGPQGIGCLYVGKFMEERNAVPLPLKFGGTGSSSEFESQPDFLPDKYESGTLNLIGIAGLGAGANFVLEQGVEKIRRKQEKLTQYLINRLEEMDNIIIYGTHVGAQYMKQLAVAAIEPKSLSVISINIRGKSASEIGDVLDREYNIAVRCGLHCSPVAHKTIGTFSQGTVRISLGYFNTQEEIDYLLNALCRIA